jgi:cob(I)alamin adenosyltransferase
LKIYTKTGDRGETGLLGGVRVSKNHVCIEVCGTLDELNSMIGLVRSGMPNESVNSLLLQIQNDLFDLGGRVANSLAQTGRQPGFGENRIAFLESNIDEIQSKLPALTHFILPDGCAESCQLHLARAVCRRAERSLVGLRELETGCDLSMELIYLNRLSDFLFVAARYINNLAGQTETAWVVTPDVPRRESS